MDWRQVETEYAAAAACGAAVTSEMAQAFAAATRETSASSQAATAAAGSALVAAQVKARAARQHAVASWENFETANVAAAKALGEAKNVKNLEDCGVAVEGAVAAEAVASRAAKEYIQAADAAIAADLGDCFRHKRTLWLAGAERAVAPADSVLS